MSRKPLSRKTVRELIEMLSGEDPDACVYIHGYESGFHDVSALKHIVVCRDVNHEGYYGPHDKPSWVRGIFWGERMERLLESKEKGVVIQ